MPRSHASCCALALALSFNGSEASAQLQPTHSNLTYAQLGTGQLRLDLYLPTGAAGPRPCVIWIHGGGWAGGSKFPIPAPCAVLVQQHGFAVASLDYRLTTQAGQYGPNVPVIFPAQIHDVKGAVRWLRAHAAQYNLDPSRIGCFGSSAGGHLSALLGTSANVAAAEGNVGGNLSFSSAVQAAADYFGPTDLLHMNDDVTIPPGSTIDHDSPNSPESHLIGWDDSGQGLGDIKKNLNNPNPPYPQLIALLDLANPVEHVDALDPPFIIAHGTNDTLVPLNQSARLHTALSSAGVGNSYIVVQGAGHGGFPLSTNNAVVAFFVQHLGTAPGDVNGDDLVNVQDLLIVIGAWGPCPPLPAGCPADIAPAGGDGAVNVNDLLTVVGHWS